MVSVPEVEISAARLVSVRFLVSDDRTAASLVPRMLTVTEVGDVPSADRTEKVSGCVVAAASSLSAERRR